MLDRFLRNILALVAMALVLGNGSAGFSRLQSTEGAPQEKTATSAEDNVDVDAISAFAKKNGARKYSRISAEMVELMSPLISSVSPSTVRIYSGKKQLAIGTVVDSSGLILTVAGELKKNMECRMSDGTMKLATVFGIDAETGLALLKVESSGLTVANFSPNISPDVGSWIASASPDHHPVSIGVVSVLERKISGGGGGAFMGVQMEPPSDKNPKGVKITVVIADSPADKADILVGDNILKVNNIEVHEIGEVQEILKGFNPGDKINVVVLRGKNELAMEVELASRDKFATLTNEQDKMGSSLSQRRQGFSAAFQHDSFLQANECGSPVVALDGQIVGINIARAGRVSTLAIPTHVVLPALERLKTGQLAPAIVNAKRIEKVDAELASLMEELKPLAEKMNQGQLEVQKQTDRVEAMKSVQADLEKKLAEMLADSNVKAAEVKKIQDRMAEIKVRTKRLEDELESLRTGSGTR